MKTKNLVCGSLLSLFAAITIFSGRPLYAQSSETLELSI